MSYFNFTGESGINFPFSKVFADPCKKFLSGDADNVLMHLIQVIKISFKLTKLCSQKVPFASHSILQCSTAKSALFGNIRNCQYFSGCQSPKSFLDPIVY